MTGFLNRVAAAAAAPPRMHPLLGSFFEAGNAGREDVPGESRETNVESSPARRERRPVFGEEQQALRQPQPFARAADPRDAAPRARVATKAEIVETAAVRAGSTGDARGAPPVAEPQRARETAPEGVAPIPASAQSADAGRRNALLPADERNQPVVHPIEFAPPLDMPRAFAPVARANEPAPLAARSERADTSARFAANERDAESVQIHIGRLEVIAVSEPAQRKPSKSDAPKYMSLDAHLARRSGRAG